MHFKIKFFFFVYFLVFQFSYWIDAAESSHIVWDEITPYLLPENHPIKCNLDAIFSRKRPLLSIETMKKAGFANPKPRKFTHLIVTSHPDLSGYIIKAYLHAQRPVKRKPEHYFWMLRIKGAQAIREEIAARGWEDIFAVPKKWIYVLPPDPSLPSEYSQKYFILVEEDMRLCSSEKNLQKWKQADRQLLGKVYVLLEHLGLHDCAKPDNIPFSLSGKIAFIDTQTFNEWPVAFEKMGRYLSPEMKEYWNELTHSNE